jgi:hypothetical protein
MVGLFAQNHKYLNLNLGPLKKIILEHNIEKKSYCVFSEEHGNGAMKYKFLIREPEFFIRILVFCPYFHD